MSDEQKASAGEQVATLRIYMKSGNVIVLPRATEVEWKGNNIGRSISITQGGPAGGERLLVKSLDLDQVEAITWETHPHAE